MNNNKNYLYRVSVDKGSIVFPIIMSCEEAIATEVLTEWFTVGRYSDELHAETLSDFIRFYGYEMNNQDIIIENPENPIKINLDNIEYK